MQSRLNVAALIKLPKDVGGPVGELQVFPGAPTVETQSLKESI